MVESALDRNLSSVSATVVELQIQQATYQHFVLISSSRHLERADNAYQAHRQCSNKNQKVSDQIEDVFGRQRYHIIVLRCDGTSLPVLRLHASSAYGSRERLIWHNDLGKVDRHNSDREEPDTQQCSCGVGGFRPHEHRSRFFCNTRKQRFA
jgi:hypothetical protein